MGSEGTPGAEQTAPALGQLSVDDREPGHRGSLPRPALRFFPGCPEAGLAFSKQRPPQAPARLSPRNCSLRHPVSQTPTASLGHMVGQTSPLPMARCGPGRPGQQQLEVTETRTFLYCVTSYHAGS